MEANRLEQERKRLTALRQCVTYCLKQVKENQAQILDNKVNNDNASFEYLLDQHEQLISLQKDIDATLEYHERTADIVDTVSSILKDMFGETPTTKQ